MSQKVDVTLLAGEDVTIDLMFHNVMISQQKNGVNHTIIVADVGDCNLIISAMEKIKQNKLMLLKGLENAEQ